MPTLDVSASYAVQAIIEDALKEDRFVFLANISEAACEQLAGLGVLALLPKADIEMSRREALERAVAKLAEHAAVGSVGQASPTADGGAAVQAPKPAGA